MSYLYNGRSSLRMYLYTIPRTKFSQCSSCRHRYSVASKAGRVTQLHWRRMCIDARMRIHTESMDVCY